LFGDTGSALAQVTAGTLRPIAVAAPERSALYPDVPTLAEEGFENLEALSFGGFSVHKDIPEDRKQRLAKAMEKALNDPAVLERIAATGWTAVHYGGEMFDAALKETYDRWKAVAERNDIRLE
jgi:tripartite-type tricarboxylate transporter receptor subunit TctC